ncbi:hypothetical protein GUITHDRAFT_134491 [Guillardia theta CCMP2712]|uniref:Uncharacterized protein n=1 Tax=Guillardia theta (strain CCMP2712) TaxID=905079 RepID=L1JT18_GUITC|nr:hypothetical protein GUITHDRAFT_134491 [Guillardia theta CCMP2712]EKX51587.1 hypothetical protein GUITHDRAFT_134491 [Guillardia theta CCMP2712]|eukprot:XP_005838567.1 hypothetical protein GUITHDRAFT_134491 [Guillardia theta CCMP2712]
MPLVQPAPQAVPLCPQETPLRHLILKLLFRTDGDFPKTEAQSGAPLNPHEHLANILSSKDLDEKIQGVLQDLGLGAASRALGDVVMLDNLLTIEILFTAPTVSDKVSVDSKKLPFKDVVEKIKNLKDEHEVFVKNSNLVSVNVAPCNHSVCFDCIRNRAKLRLAQARDCMYKTFGLVKELEQAMEKESKTELSYQSSLQEYANIEKQFYAARRKLQALDPSKTPEKQYKAAVKVLTGSEEGDFKDGCEYNGGLFLSKKTAATKAAKLEAALQNLSIIVHEKRAALAVATAHEIVFGQAHEKATSLAGPNCPSIYPRQFTCTHSCGFMGTQEVVQYHEKACGTSYQCSVCGARGSFLQAQMCEQQHSMMMASVPAAIPVSLLSAPVNYGSML